MSLRRFSFFGLAGSQDGKQSAGPSRTVKTSPSLTLKTDKEIYRPGDWINATVEISVPKPSKGSGGDENEDSSSDAVSLLVNSLAFEIKGMEKLDAQWFAILKPPPGSKQRRGEHLFLDSSTPSMVSKVVISSGSTRTYVVQAELPKGLPPSYRGATIRYIYYVRSVLCGRWLKLENSNHNYESSDDSIQMEARIPLQIWVTQKNSNFVKEGSFFAGSLQSDIYWKENDADSEWIRANEVSDVFEEGYDSSRDEISSVSSYNPTRGNIDHAFRSTLSLQSMITRISNNEVPYSLGERSSFLSYRPITQLSVAEVEDDSDIYSPSALSPSMQRKDSSSFSPFASDTGKPSTSKSDEPVASESFIRGRSYNIRIDDQVLLRFSPRNSDSTYYFGDLIGGTLTFFHEEGSRRCLEVSVTLETLETISQQFIHPSRRTSPSITKVQSDHYEVVADLVQTSFLFSIPMDGPMTFSSQYVSLEWVLRFEFFTTPKHVDLNRYEHPLLIEEREKGDWILPITVHAPPARAQAAHLKKEKPFVGNLWIRT